MADEDTWTEFETLQSRALSKGCFPGERAWLYWDGLSVYLRFTKTLQDGDLTPTLQLASLEAETPGNGIFRQLLPQIENACRLPVIEVENVIEQRFADFLRRQGYVARRVPGMAADVLPCPFRKRLVQT